MSHEEKPHPKADIIRRYARNEPRALANPAAFLAERKLAVPETLEEQQAAVRSLFAEARKRHGIE